MSDLRNSILRLDHCIQCGILGALLVFWLPADGCSGMLTCMLCLNDDHIIAILTHDGTNGSIGLNV